MAQLTIDLAEGQDFSIVSQKVRYKIFPYTAHGRAQMTQDIEHGFDTGSVLKDLSKGATWMFWTLESTKCRKRLTNVCTLKKANLTKEEAGRIQRAYSELEAAKLIVRIASSTYLMNPKAILPELSECQTVWHHWCTARKNKGLPI
jgi:hypothetical protein